MVDVSVEAGDSGRCGVLKERASNLEDLCESGIMFALYTTPKTMTRGRGG